MRLAAARETVPDDDREMTDEKRRGRDDLQQQNLHSLPPFFRSLSALCSLGSARGKHQPLAVERTRRFGGISPPCIAGGARLHSERLPKDEKPERVCKKGIHSVARPR